MYVEGKKVEGMIQNRLNTTKKSENSTIIETRLTRNMDQKSVVMAKCKSIEK